jgi:hypothetical protein
MGGFIPTGTVEAAGGGSGFGLLSFRCVGSITTTVLLTEGNVCEKFSKKNTFTFERTKERMSKYKTCLKVPAMTDWKLLNVQREKRFLFSCCSQVYQLNEPLFSLFPFFSL